VRQLRSLSTLFLLALTATLLGGCATLGGEAPPPVTVPEVVQMSKEGVPDYQIISEMRKSGTVYRLSAEELADLRDQGVADPVINYMQRTYLEAVRRRQELADWDNWTNRDGWWYGGSPYGWPDDWVP
jgi:hypothetical protein